MQTVFIIFPFKNISSYNLHYFLKIGMSAVVLSAAQREIFLKDHLLPAIGAVVQNRPYPVGPPTAPTRSPCSRRCVGYGSPRHAADADARGTHRRNRLPARYPDVAGVFPAL